MLKKIILFFLILLPNISVACKCAAPSEFDAVFTGIVTGIKSNADDGFSQMVSFSSIQLIRGSPLTSNKIYNPNVLLCGYTFKIDSTYKVFIMNTPKPHTKYCYGNKLQ